MRCGAAAHTGPGRKGPEAWPPRKKVGAEERSPSAPLLEPSIVKEPGGEAPRFEAGEPHSPVPLPSGGDFAAFNEPFAPLPRVSKRAKATSRLVPCPQRPFSSRSDGASPPPRRIPCSSHLTKAGERLIPRLASRPKGREWSAKGSSGHAHCKKRVPIPGECSAISGE
jgi:hypothetical protein